MSPFIGRTRELATLTREFDRPRPALVVLYGRRRVGKSTLLLHAVGTRPHIYYQATRVADPDAQALFRQHAATIFGEDPLLPNIGGWEGLFRYLHHRAQTTHPGLIIVLDEFPYLCDAAPALPSIIQKVWDEVQRAGTHCTIVLCGSRLSFMSELLYERNPLYGRQTAKLDIAPLPYRDAAAFFPAWSAEDQLRAYAVFGGMPYYLHLCDPNRSLGQNIRALILEDGAVLRETSLDVQGRDRTRATRFVLNDFFLTFYYRFVLPHLSALEAGAAAHVYRHVIAPMLDAYMGDPFEVICRSYIRQYGTERLPSPAKDVGKIWLPNADIDVAGTLLDGSALFGECTWSKKHVGLSVLDHLSAAAQATRYGTGTDARYYLLFARSGFSPELRKRAIADPTVRLVTLEQLLRETV